MSSLKIGNVELSGRVIAAPMAGITDLPFRRICKSLGAALVVTEMVSAKAILHRNENTKQLLQTQSCERPVSVQIFGSDPVIMGKVASMLDDSDFDIIDINMGCPAPKIVRNGDGSALLRDPALIGRIVSAVSKSTKKPTTVKIRLGYDSTGKNFLETAKIAQESGAAAVTVHGRTRPQMYSGEADWESIGLVKNTVSIPVIGNGDIDTPQMAQKRLVDYGVDAVMIGRAMCGNPWLIKRAHHLIEHNELLPEPNNNEKLALALSHLQDTIAFKGEFVGIREMRKHLAWYIKGRRGAAQARVKINSADCLDEIIKILTDFFVDTPQYLVYNWNN